jgi:hypothetical protein
MAAFRSAAPDSATASGSTSKFFGAASVGVIGGGQGDEEMRYQLGMLTAGS